MAKVTTKKSVKKPVAKKPAAKKTAVKKVTVKKSASKKAAPKKVAAKKTAVKKAAAKKPVAAKVVAKKSAPNKIAAKKTTVKLTPSVKSVKKVAPKSADIKKTVSNTPAVVKQPKKHNNKNNKLRYSVKDLIFFKKILVEEKQKIIASAKANMKSLVDSESGDYVGDDLSYASHMAEQGTDEMEREKNYMFVQRDEKYLGHIEEALTRIDQGTYGVCIDCIDIPKNYCKTCPLIPKERLEIVPITQHCIECKNIRG